MESVTALGELFILVDNPNLDGIIGFDEVNMDMDIIDPGAGSNSTKALSKVWERFAILYNVEGKKHFIGMKYGNGRVPIQQMLLLNDLEVRKWTKNKEYRLLVEITLKGNDLWIRALRGSQILVSGEKIGIQSKGPSGLTLNSMPEMRLTFGNVFYLGDGDKTTGFLLKEIEDQGTECAMEEDPPNVDVEAMCQNQSQPQPGSMVARNTLIVSRILSYLPMKDIKNARLTSRLWYNETQQIWEKGTALKFYPWGRYKSPESEESKDQIHQESSATAAFTRFSRYMKDNWAMSLPHWTFCIPPFGNTNRLLCKDYELSLGPGEPGERWIFDLEYFLRPEHPHSVSQLKLKGRISNQLEFDIRMKLLVRLASTLEDLELSGFLIINKYAEDYNIYATAASSPSIHDEAPPLHLSSLRHPGLGDDPIRFPDKGVNFPKLVRFTLSLSIAAVDAGHYYRSTFYNYETEIREPYTISFLGPEFIEQISGVRELYLKTEMPLTMTVLRRLDGFRNLEEISLQQVTPSGIVALLQLNQPLKKLELGELSKFVCQRHLRSLRELLHRHSGSLKTLGFVVTIPEFYRFLSSYWRINCTSPPQQPDLVLKLPQLPALIKLNLGLIMDLNVGETDRRMLMKSVDFGVDEQIGGKIVYERDFPTLKSFVVKLCVKNSKNYRGSENLVKEYDDFLASFFNGAESQVCNSLRYLDILIEDEKDCPPLWILSENGSTEMARMFPHVVNERMNKIRKEMEEKGNGC